MSATEFKVDGCALDYILEHGSELMAHMRAVPEQENGRTLGVRMYGIRPQTVFDKFGMKDGDRIETVNGISLSSHEQLLEAYGHLRTSRHVTIQLNRSGSNMTLEYTVE